MAGRVPVNRDMLPPDGDTRVILDEMTDGVRLQQRPDEPQRQQPSGAERATQSRWRRPVRLIRPTAPTAAAAAAHASANSVLTKGSCSTRGNIEAKFATRSAWPLTASEMRIHLATKYTGRTRKRIPRTGRTSDSVCGLGTSDVQWSRSTGKEPPTTSYHRRQPGQRTHASAP